MLDFESSLTLLRVLSEDSAVFIEELRNALQKSLRIAVLIGPTGSGKSEIAKALRMADPTLQWLKSTTTRPVREQELNADCEYDFVTREEFLRLSNKGALAWQTDLQRGGNLYGTQHVHIERALAASYVSLALLRPQEAKLLKSWHPDQVVNFYLHVPEKIRRDRILQQRGDDPDYLGQGLQDSNDWIHKALLMYADHLIDRFVHNTGNPLLALEEIYGAIQVRSGKVF